MFKKIKCKKCGEKVSKKNSFCPHCGNYLSPYKKSKERDWGMLGHGEGEIEDELSNSMFGGFGGKMFGKVLNQTIKMLEKEIQKGMQESMKQQNQNPGIPPSQKNHFELFINGKRINPENIKVTQKPIQFTENPIQKTQKENANKNKFFPVEKVKIFSELPKKEPKTELRRLPDKIVYEISIPGVKSLDEVSIIKLENSIEIKAISKDKAYSKIIPINLDISSYGLSKGKLVLELTE